MQVKPIEHHSQTLGSLEDQLRELSISENISLKDFVEIRDNFSHLHVELLKNIKTKLNLASIHGQTLYHKPPQSLQLLNSSIVAQHLSVTVVSDLRAADLALGGEGAPITPLADYIIYADSKKKVIVNLGGFCNITFLPKKKEDAHLELFGKDVCACNHILDSLCRDRLNIDYDENGSIAAKGNSNRAFVDCLKKRLYSQNERGDSLGTGDECFELIKDLSKEISTEDVLKSICIVIAEMIGEVGTKSEEIVLAGGGCLNKTLVEEIKKASEVDVVLSDEYGIPTQYREAVGMAVLGALCEDKVPITIEGITGLNCPAPISGVWVYSS